jgi:hypothetical protein
MSTKTILVLIGTIYSAVVLYVAWSLIQVRSELDKRIDELAAERRRLRETQEQSLELVDKVVPLIEKTAWDVYWRAGNSGRAVAEENDRNIKVEIARKALWKIPLVRDHIRNIPGASK